MRFIDSSFKLLKTLWIFQFLWIYILRGMVDAVNISTVEQACNNGTQITVAWWIQEPYIYEQNGKKKGVLLDILEKELHACCKAGFTISYLPPEKEDATIDEVLSQKLDHVVLPIGRNAHGTTSVYNRPFVGLVESPGIALVTGKTVSGADLLTAIVNSWPILVFIVTSLCLTGFVVWLLDHRCNPEEFPEFFPLGVFEGFWWAAVTMTTVGYGDKVPRSVASRLFAVIWINAGLVIIAMFMGIVTASLSTNTVGQASHLYGLGVSARNGSVEYQYAVFQSADVKALRTFEDVYSSVSNGDSQIALVDLYSVTSHEQYLEKHKLYVGSVLEHSIMYGVVLPRNSVNLKECLMRYEESHKEESYILLDKYLTHGKDPNSGESYGTDYFDGSIFGYSVYAMTGLFVVVMGVGLWWQKYYKPRRGEWREEQETQGTELTEIELSTTKSDHPDGQLASSNQASSPRMAHGALTADRGAERLMAQQSSELLRIMEEYKAYRQSWQKSFKMLQERHRREQREMFQLDNNGYDM